MTPDKKEPEFPSSDAPETEDRFSAFDLPTRPDEAAVNQPRRLNKRTRQLLIAVAVAAALALLLLLVTLIPHNGTSGSSGDPNSEPAAVYTLYDKTGVDDKTPVTAVDIRNGNGEFQIAYHPATAGYVLTGYEDIPLSQNVDSLIEASTVLSAGGKINSVETAAAYGLDAPAATVTIHYADNSVGTLTVGNAIPSGEGYYVRMADSDDVYLVDKSTVTYFLSADWWYVSTTLMSPPTVREDDAEGTSLLRSLTLTGTNHAQRLSLRRVNSSDAAEYAYFKYVTTEPFFRGVMDGVGDALYAFNSLYADRAAILHPTAEQLKKYGFNNPYTVAKVTLAVESTTESKNSATGETESTAIVYNSIDYTITVGCLDTDGNYVVMVDGVDVIYIVAQDSLYNLVERQHNNTTSSLLFLKDITLISRVEIALAGEKHTFALAHHPAAQESDDKLTVSTDGKTTGTADFRKLYSLMMGLQRYDLLQGSLSGTPDLSIALYDVEGKQYFAADFYNATGSLTGTRTTDGETFSVKTSTVTKLMTQLRNYLNGDPVLEV